MSAKRLRVLPAVPPPFDAEPDAPADAARDHAAPAHATPDRSGLRRAVTPPGMDRLSFTFGGIDTPPGIDRLSFTSGGIDWLMFTFNEPADEAAFVAAQFRQVYGLQMAFLVVLLVAGLAMVRSDDEQIPPQHFFRSMLTLRRVMLA